MTRKLILSTMVSLTLLGIHSLATAENSARIAVAAEGSTADAPISRLAARCPYFLLFNEQGGSWWRP